MLSIFKEERDPEGRVVLEIGMNSTLLRIALILGVLIALGVFYFAVGSGPLGMPWYLIAGPIIAGAIGYSMFGWIAKRTKARITIDNKAGNLFVANSAGQSQVRMADMDRAEFGTSSTSKGSVVYRLEFVMKDGERIPATTGYTNAYGSDIREKTIAAINAALGRQMV